MKNLQLTGCFALALVLCACDRPAPAHEGEAEAAAATAPGVAPGASLGDASPVRYRCGDRLVDVDIGADQVRLRFDADERVLPMARSASGARYAQDGDEFWSRGEDATLTLGGERSQCQRSEETTPWEDARARGIAVRVVGSEPGWLAEVGPGPTPALRLSLDYGTRELLFERTEIADGAMLFRGESAEATVELRLAETRCEDAMSGESFALTAELAIGNDRYRGCGRRLDE